jgi:UDP-4-amino-4,6-dideoxy-N-acetyl-beta-L-altrosamine N-acetyltransferase
MLKDNDILLRALKEDDSTLFYTWRNDLEYIKNTKSFRLPKHEGLEKEWVDNVMTDKGDKSVVLIIETDKPIGFIQATNIDWVSRNCYFGIAICEESERGKGIGKRSMKLLFDYLFGELNMHKVSLEVTSFNENSIALYESFGFKREGTLREHYYWNNEYHDVHIYGLMKNEYSS